MPLQLGLELGRCNSLIHTSIFKVHYRVNCPLNFVQDWILCQWVGWLVGWGFLPVYSTIQTFLFYRFQAYVSRSISTMIDLLFIWYCNINFLDCRPLCLVLVSRLYFVTLLLKGTASFCSLHALES